MSWRKKHEKKGVRLQGSGVRKSVAIKRSVVRQLNQGAGLFVVPDSLQKAWRAKRYQAARLIERLRSP